MHQSRERILGFNYFSAATKPLNSKVPGSIISQLFFFFFFPVIKEIFQASSLNGHEFEYALGVRDGQGSQACFSP